MADTSQHWMIYAGQADTPVRFPEAYTETTGDPAAFLARYTPTDNVEITALIKRAHSLPVGASDQIRTRDGGVIRIVRTQ